MSCFHPVSRHMGKQQHKFIVIFLSFLAESCSQKKAGFAVKNPTLTLTSGTSNLGKALHLLES